MSSQALRIAVEGCVSFAGWTHTNSDTFWQGHGTLDAIYASVQKSCEVRGWDGVDLL